MYGGSLYSNDDMAGITAMFAMTRGGFRKPYGYTSGYTPDNYGYSYNTSAYSNYMKNSYGKSWSEKTNHMGNYPPGYWGTIGKPTFPGLTGDEDDWTKPESEPVTCANLFQPEVWPNL